MTSFLFLKDPYSKKTGKIHPFTGRVIETYQF